MGVFCRGGLQDRGSFLVQFLPEPQQCFLVTTPHSRCRCSTPQRKCSFTIGGQGAAAGLQCFVLHPSHPHTEEPPGRRVLARSPMYRVRIDHPNPRQRQAKFKCYVSQSRFNSLFFVLGASYHNSRALSRDLRSQAEANSLSAAVCSVRCERGPLCMENFSY